MDLVAQLRRDEGVARFPYRDTVGKLSIGVGHNLDDVGLSDDEIDFLLKDDIDAATGMLREALPWFNNLDPVRQGVLVNMSFNLRHRLLGFHDTLAFMAKGDWENASTAMLNSLWAKQVGERATRLATQLQTGEWQ